MSDERDLSISSESGEARSKRIGRRALMLGVAGAGATTSLIAHAGQAEAATDGDLILGESNSATGTTEVSSTGATGLQGQTVTKGQSGVAGIDTGSEGGHGTYGRSVNGIGAYGTSLETGVYGSGGSIGVYGESTFGIGVYGTPDGGGSGLLGTTIAGTVGDSSTKIGVLGVSNGNDGVRGETFHDAFSGVAGIDGSTGGGFGVAGYSTEGVGVLASNTSGTALSVKGVATFSRSGHASIGAGMSSITVAGVALSSSSMVLATLQNSLSGVYVESAVPNVSDGSFVVNLSVAVPSGHTAHVGWFVVN